MDDSGKAQELKGRAKEAAGDLTGDRELTLVLGTGTELRLGNSGDIRLKLSIAKQILPIANGASYLDVSVPERPVAGYNSQVAS